LLRVARTPSGLRVDALGPDRACVDAAMRRGALVSALRVGLAEEELARLRTDIEEALPAT
jgi:hypothetical protein